MEATREPRTKRNYNETPFFKKVLGIASDIVMSRFRLIKLVHKAFSRLAHPDDGKSLRQEAVEQLGLFLRMLKATIKGEYKRVPVTSLVRIVASVLYFVMLVDIIPDFVPVVGFVDDAFILAWAYNGVRRDIDAFEAWEKAGVVDLEEMKDSQPPMVAPIVQPTVVEG